MEDRKERIVGRLCEQRTLDKIYNSERAEFLAVYGRRRVGKTYLIRKFFADKDCIYFQITGIKDGKLLAQLYEFTRVVEKTFYKTGTTLKEPVTWMQALEMLTTAIAAYSSKKKIILFLMSYPG